MESLMPLSAISASFTSTAEEAEQHQDEDEIQITAEIFVTSWSTLRLTLRVKPSCTIQTLKKKITSQMQMYQDPDSFPYYNVLSHAFYLGKQLLQDGSTLAECNASNMERLSVLPSSPFLITAAHTTAPENWPIIDSIEVNSLEFVGSLKKKIFEWTHIPSHKQVLGCGGQWILDDERRLLDLGIVQQTSNGTDLLDMPLLHVIPYRRIKLENKKFDISVKVPHCKLQFRLTVHPTDTINHVKSMILQKSSIYDENHMLIFNDNNLLEDGCSVLLDHVIEEGSLLTLCQKGSFLIWVSRKGSDEKFTVEVKSLDTVEVLKKKIQKMTDISSEDQVLFYEADKHQVTMRRGCLVCYGNEADKCQVVMHKGCLVRYGIVMLSDPKVPEHMISYSDDDKRTKVYLSWQDRVKEVYVPRVPLSFWKKLSNSASAGVLVEDFLMQENPGPSTDASFKIHILVPLIVHLTFHMTLTMRLGDTIEILKTKIKQMAKLHKEIDDLTYVQEGDYALRGEKRQIHDDGFSTIEHCGITSECQILLCPKASFSITACFPPRCLELGDDEKTSGLNNINEQTIVVNCLDTVAILKDKISANSRFPMKFIELSFDGTTLSNEKLLVEYGFLSPPVSPVDRRWRHFMITLNILVPKLYSAM